ncbi:hypothetical protein VZT92_016389 [Zoarces viviparus]|uniref:Uncharacterized protein n=1 Tax=Zoarces viviparus TaxID=48416 RepID=A0AAW1EUQ4_ZOAVI
MFHLRLRHDSTEPTECFKYSSRATRLLYTPASRTDDPRLLFQLFQLESTSRLGEVWESGSSTLSSSGESLAD